MNFPAHQVKFIGCDCGDLMHTLKVEYWDDEMNGMDSVEFSVMMPQERPWYKRIIPALRYLLNMRGSEDWHYTCISMQHETVAELQKMLDQYQSDRSAYWDHKEGKAETYEPARGYSITGQGW